MAKLGFTDNDGIDVGNKYVAKEYVMDRYPNIALHSDMPSLWAWGDLGAGGVGSNAGSSSPNSILGAALNWKQVSCAANSVGAFSGTTSAAVRTDGTLWTWGSNNFGQLGTATTTSRSSPNTVAGAGTDWARVSVGQAHTAAVKTNGTLYTWGRNNIGQLGSASTTNRSSPVTIVGGFTDWLTVSCGYEHTAAIRTNGILYTWGNNTQGQLGDGTTTNRSSPNTVAGGGTNWTQISVGFLETGAIKSDGTLWTWGNNSNGQLGDNSSVNKSSPVTTVAGGTNWKQVSMMGSGFNAIKTDGTLWSCGYNFAGQLGTGEVTSTNKSSPVTVAGGGKNWIRLTTGFQNCRGAIKADGTLWMWGNGNSGQLGNTFATARSSPVTVAGAGYNWKQIATSTWTSLALREEDDW